jgi:formate dehydrogenase major subunit
VLVEEDLVGHAFIAERVEGWDEFRAFIRAHTPEVAERISGVPAEKIRAAARLYGRAARPMALHGLGVTEHLQGSEAVMLICNLALLTGALGREGVGVNPLRGQNNVQGSADMGCQPDLLTGYAPVADPAARARFEAVWGRPLPATPGRTLPRMYEAALDGQIRAMVIFGEDVLQTDPDTRHTRAALESLDFLVVQELFLSETARLAHVVLPGASFLEKDGTFTNGERRIQRIRRAIDPVPGSRPDWEILLALMAATGFPQPFRDPAAVMDEIASVAPIFAGVSYGRLGPDGLQWPVPAADHPGTATLHVETFPRGRGRLSRIEFVASPELRPGLTLVTGRRLEHYNAGTMTRRTPNLTLAPDERLEIHPEDARSRGIGSGDRALVASDHGEAVVPVELTTRVPPGTVHLTFHFPGTGTNRLTGRVRDRLSDCPEYKVTSVEVRRAPE